ncbi:MAG: sodium:solute symporter family protein [Peptococcaceae bacterium]|nr:sodium:solute symporter family protein [Peptococcaceae bacterium]
MNKAILLTIMGLYLAVTIGLGYLAYRRTRTTGDYLIAGGNAHPFLMAMAYGSTFISTSAIVGFGGAAGVYGMSLLWLTFCNIFVGIFLAFVLYGKKTTVVGRELSAKTFPDLLGKRYDSVFIQRFAGAVIMLAMPLYAAAVMIGAARFIQETLGIDYTAALLVFAVIVAAYVMTGGLKGILYTDAFQGSIMFAGMGLLLLFTYGKLGGVTAAHQALTGLASKVPASLAAKGHLGWTAMPALGSEIWWIVVSTLVLGVGVGVLAQPQLVTRYLTVSGPREINRAVVVGGVFIIMMTGVAFVVGALSNVYFMQETGKISLAATVNPAVAGSVPNVDLIIPMYINNAMPQWFSYLFMITLMAAAMSTLSGQFHAIGSSLGYDLVKNSSLRLNRSCIIVALLVTLWISLKLPVSIIATATAIFFGICAATFLPAYTAALYWKGASRAGVIASMITGLSVSLFMLLFTHGKESSLLGLCQYIFGKPSLAGFPWVVVDPIVIALPVSTVVMVAVSLATGPAADVRAAKPAGAAK